MNEDKSELEILVEERENLQQKLQNMIEHEEGADDREYDEESSYMSSPQYEMDEILRKIEKLNAKIGEIYYEQEKNIYQQEYDKKIVDYTRGSILSDLINTEDIFDRRERTKTLAQYIIDKTTKTPFNTGIFARWGEGKTTFLNYLQEELRSYNTKEKKKGNNNFKTYVVNYDASEYTEKDKIWASIMKQCF